MKNTDAHLLRLLVTFELAARVGGFAKAGAELNLSRVAISRQMARLEAHLGCTLFSRNHRSVSLTAAGRALYEEVSPALETIARALQAARPAQHPRLVITATAAFATFWLMPRMARFNALHPDAEIDLVVSDTYLDLAAEGIDIAVRYGAAAPDGMAATVLVRETIIPVYSPHYARRTDLSTVEDLSRERLLFLKGPYRREAGWPHWFARFGIDIAATAGIAFNTYLNMFQAALAGQGVALAGRPLVDDYLADGTLRQVDGIAPVERDDYVLINRAPQSALAAAWSEWLTAELAAVGKRHSVGADGKA